MQNHYADKNHQLMQEKQEILNKYVFLLSY